MHSPLACTMAWNSGDHSDSGDRAGHLERDLKGESLAIYKRTPSAGLMSLPHLPQYIYREPILSELCYFGRNAFIKILYRFCLFPLTKLFFSNEIIGLTVFLIHSDSVVTFSGFLQYFLLGNAIFTKIVPGDETDPFI